MFWLMGYCSAGPPTEGDSQLLPATVTMLPELAEMLNPVETAVTLPELATSVYPLSALLMLSVENVAVPVASVTAENTPESVPEFGLFPIAMLTVDPTTAVFVESVSFTFTAGMIAPASVSVGCAVNVKSDPPAGLIVIERI